MSFQAHWANNPQIKMESDMYLHALSIYVSSQNPGIAFGPFCLNLWIKWIEITLKSTNTSVTGLIVFYIEFIGLNIVAVTSFQLQSPSVQK